jgi:hypothetical protein
VKAPESLKKKGIVRAEHDPAEVAPIKNFGRLVMTFFGDELMQRSDLVEWRGKEPDPAREE